MPNLTIDVFSEPHGFTRIAITSTNYTYIVTIDPITGCPFYSGIPSVDIFPSHETALSYLKDTFSFSSHFHPIGLLGVAQSTSGAAYLGIVTAATVTGRLPPDHIIQTVTEVRYLPLNSTESCPFEGFQLPNNHYFCQSYDLTQTFPGMEIENSEFVWNSEWKAPFRRLGLGFCCISLIQGVALTGSFRSDGFWITHLLRRSCLNGGTRYCSRGLNEEGDPGNEVEGELVFWDGTKFWTHWWRRGSAPIRWRTELKTSFSAPLHLPEDDASRGTADYFKRLRAKVPLIRVVSLLETSSRKGEFQLHTALQKALEELEIPFIVFDVNEVLKELGPIRCQAEFEKVIESFVDWTVGTLDPLLVEGVQAGLNRYNCADSLDRTNLITFFVALMCVKQWHPDQTIVDFLAKAFVTSGNVVSSLSTNTNAIKVEAFRAFSPSLGWALSDTAVTLERRIQNVAFDPSRNEILHLFVRPPPLPGTVALDFAHLGIMGDFPFQLFQTTEAQFLLSDARETTILLPRELRLRSVTLHACTAESFLAVGDGDHVFGVHPVPETTSPCAYVFSDSFITRFLTLRFFAPREGFICGHIRIACEIPEAQIHRIKLEMNGDVDEDFTEFIDEYLQTQGTIGDCLVLERNRFNCRISEKSFFDACSRYLVNPFVFDAAARLLAPPPTGCAFCGKDYLIVDHFRQNPLVPATVLLDPTGPLACCSECRSFVETVLSLSDIYAMELLEPEPVPDYQPVLTLPEPSIISTTSTASFSDIAWNSLLGDDGPPITFPVDTVFHLFFVRRAILSSVIVASDTTPLVTFPKSADISQSAPNEFIFTFPEDCATQQITFSLKGPATVSSVKANGRFVSTDASEWPPARVVVDFSIPERDCEWSELTRTAVYRFENMQRLRRVLVTVVEPHVQNLILWFLVEGEDSKTRQCEQLTLPRTSRGSKLYFSWNRYSFDEVRVFYTDRVARFVPHRLGFDCE
jgi:hypothetical protein